MRKFLTLFGAFKCAIPPLLLRIDMSDRSRLVDMKVSVLAVLIAVPLVSLAACSTDSPPTSHEQVDRADQQSAELTAEQRANNKKRKMTCGSMPPIQDRSKLKANLVKNGVITPEMSQEEADEKVAEFIRKKQQAFKHCPKTKSEGSPSL